MDGNPVRRFRRGRRALLAGLCIVVGAMVGGDLAMADRRGLLVDSEASASAPDPDPMMGTSGRRTPSTAAGFTALSPRLRGVTLASEALPTAVVTEPVAAPLTPAVRVDLAIAPPPARFEEPAAPATAPPRKLQESQSTGVTPSGGTWALLVGINDYPGERYDLRSAVNDVNDVDQALAKLGVTADRRMVLRDRQASAGIIRSGLDWLTDHAGSDATMVVFFAGHVQKVGNGSEALVGADGAFVRDVELASLLDRSPSKRAWIGIAACYGGGFSEVVKPGRILTAAAPADSLAYENDGFGRSYLVEYMIRRAMLARGITTVEAAFAAASAELRREYPDREPVQIDQFGGELDLRAAPPSRDPAPPPAGGAPSDGSPPRTSAPPPPSSPPPSSPPPSSPPPSDGCADLTIGVVSCKD